MFAVSIFYFTVNKNNYSDDLKNGLFMLAGLVILQIILGIFTVISNVQIAIALTHQAGALSLFALMIYFIHRFRAMDSAQ